MRYGLDMRFSKIVANLQVKLEEECQIVWNSWNLEKKIYRILDPIEMEKKRSKLPYRHNWGCGRRVLDTRWRRVSSWCAGWLSSLYHLSSTFASIVNMNMKSADKDQGYWVTFWIFWKFENWWTILTPWCPWLHEHTKRNTKRRMEMIINDQKKKN
jgi:hypothetical protein